MGEYVEEIGDWFDRNIFQPVCKVMKIVWIIIVAFGAVCVPVAAVKYLFF